MQFFSFFLHHFSGDPSNNHDLVRVRAHKATSVLVMMNSVDFEEQVKPPYVIVPDFSFPK